MKKAIYRVRRPFLVRGAPVAVDDLVELDGELATWLLEHGRVESVDSHGVQRRPGIYYVKPDAAVVAGSIGSGVRPR